MAWYKLYAGLGGGFGGATYECTAEFDNEDEALNAAYDLAFDEYASYEGYHGILSWDDCLEEYEETWGMNHTDSDIDDYYNEQVESWIEYYVVEATGPDDVDDF